MYKNVQSSTHADKYNVDFNVSISASFSSTTTTNADTLRKYQHHLLPTSDRFSSLQRPGSIQETPLPPLPKEDHTYEELKLKREPVKEEVEEDDDYLPPIKSAASRKASVDTLDIDDYLKPTFNQFEQINTRDLSPPTEAPPPIPKVSYSQVTK